MKRFLITKVDGRSALVVVSLDFGRYCSCDLHDKVQVCAFIVGLYSSLFTNTLVLCVSVYARHTLSVCVYHNGGTKKRLV